MKRLLFLLALPPFLVNGQNVVEDKRAEQTRIQTPVEDVMLSEPAEDRQENASSEAPKRMSGETPEHYKKLKKESVFVDFYNLGITRYDLQTNNSLGRKIKAYEDSSISAVWTQGEDEPNFTNDRGTGYNHYDGNAVSRTPEDVGRLENVRTGWPNIGTFGSGDNRTEFTLSHIAGDPNEGSGGYAFSENDGIGSTNFTTSLNEGGNGPIWWRTATAGDWVHMVGTYTTSTAGEDPVVDGVTRPMVYYRSDDRGQTWEDSAVILPGYANTSKRDLGTADIYSIDARDSIVAIVLAENVMQLTMWKSTDNGETWDMHEIESSGFDLGTFRGGLWNLDTVGQQIEVGSDTFNGDHVTSVIDEDGTVHVSWNIVKAYRDGSADDSGSYYYQPYVDGIKYWNDEHTEQQFFDRVDTNYKDSTAYNFRVDGSTTDTFYVSYDTAYQYSYDTANDVKDSSVLHSPKVVEYDSFANASMQAFEPTDTAWSAYYSIEFDANGNRIDSTYHVDDTLYLDSNEVKLVSGYDSVYMTEKDYTFQSRLIGGTPTIDTLADLSYTGSQSTRYPYGTPISSRPTIARGGEDTLYVVYEAMVAGSGSEGAERFDYRDLYVTYTVDGGQTWADEVNITNTAMENGESAYPSLNKTMVNDQLHLVWQEDNFPDEYASQSDGSTQGFFTDNYINYAAIDKSSIFNPVSGIGETKANAAFEATAYPNPFGAQVNVEFELEQSSEVGYKLYDVMGQVKQQENLGQMSRGSNEVQLQTSGLSKGVYFLKIHSDEGTKSLKVVKQ